MALGLHIFDRCIQLSDGHIWTLYPHFLRNNYLFVSRLCCQTIFQQKWRVGVDHKIPNAKYCRLHAGDKTVDRKDPRILWFAYRLRRFADKLLGIWFLGLIFGGFICIVSDNK